MGEEGRKVEMNYCPRCGARLTERSHPEEGPTAYCENCGDYRFPLFSTAVGMVVWNPERTKLILIRQYGEAEEVLPAGYVDKGENGGQAAVRELKEELGLEAMVLGCIGSHYYAPSETLMLTYEMLARDREVRPNHEVDSWRWVSLEEARRSVRPEGLALVLLGDLAESSGCRIPGGREAGAER